MPEGQAEVLEPTLAKVATDPTIVDPRATIRADSGSFDEALLPTLPFADLLYEALAGDAPHAAGTPRQMMAKVLIDRSPRRPPGAPPELAAIVAKAMAYHPADRFESLAAFRSALAEFVVHRDALQVTGRAERLLERVLASESDDSRADLIEARSAFRSALSLWEGNERAHTGLDRSHDALCERELSDGNWAAAAAWAAERSQPNEALLARVEAEREAQAREAEELEALRDEAAERDLAEWARNHRVRIHGYAAAFIVVGFVGGALLRAGYWTLGYLELGLIQGFFLLATLYSVRVGATNTMSRKMAQLELTASGLALSFIYIARGLAEMQREEAQ